MCELVKLPKHKNTILRDGYKIKSVDGKPTYKASLVAKDWEYLRRVDENPDMHLSHSSRDNAIKHTFKSHELKGGSLTHS